MPPICNWEATAIGVCPPRRRCSTSPGSFLEKNTDCAMNMRGDFWLVDDRGKTSPGHWEIDYACGPQYRYIKAIQPKGHVRAVRP